MRSHIWLSELYINLQGGCACEHPCEKECICVSTHIYIYAYTHACIILPPISIKFICAFACMCVLPVHQTIHLWFKFLLQDRRKTLKDRVLNGQEHLSILRIQPPENLVRGSLKPIKGFGQGRFKVRFCKHL